MTVKPLDYPKQKLLIDVTSEIEEKWRVIPCKKEPWTVDFIERAERGAGFVDIGANVGGYTLIALANGLNPVAIEPHFASYARLCQNLALNNMLDKVICFPTAVGPVSGFNWFHFADMRVGSAQHVLGGTQKQFFHRQLVQTWTLDNIMAMVGSTNPFYIKIDVDGGEMGVLQGAVETLHSPNLRGMMIEMQLDQADELMEFLASAGWTLKERWDERGIAYGEFVRA